ncbi:multiprotein-bridging factor 1 family protein [Catenulispora yoronensis]
MKSQHPSGGGRRRGDLAVRDGGAFGRELRRLRLTAGMSQAELANVLHFSKSYLSKVENGAKPATMDLARRCEAVLGAAGRWSRCARRLLRLRLERQRRRRQVRRRTAGSKAASREARPERPCRCRDSFRPDPAISSGAARS